MYSQGYSQGKINKDHQRNRGKWWGELKIRYEKNKTISVRVKGRPDPIFHKPSLNLEYVISAP